MARTRGRKLDQKNGPFFFIMLAFLLYLLVSVTIAASTAEDCPGEQSWRVFPPGWECHGRFR
jgi:hypothetical protein